MQQQSTIMAYSYGTLYLTSSTVMLTVAYETVAYVARSNPAVCIILMMS